MTNKGTFVPISNPALISNEFQYVTKYVETNSVCSLAKYVTGLEEVFADFWDTKHAATSSNGTTALHCTAGAGGSRAMRSSSQP
jgi:perosamine synthetase